jgi:hypothetical protein
MGGIGPWTFFLYVLFLDGCKTCRNKNLTKSLLKQARNRGKLIWVGLAPGLFFYMYYFSMDAKHVGIKISLDFAFRQRKTKLRSHYVEAVHN